jgi:hypothetical protein
MASQWFRRSGDTEDGPFSFQELAEQIRAGVLTPDTLVRRAEQNEWIRIDEVVGLLRAAKSQPVPQRAADKAGASQRPAAPKRPAAVAPPRVRSRWTRPLSRRQLKAGIALAVVAASAAFGISWWFHRPKQPPRIASATMERAIPSRLAQMLANPPASPTIPGLPPGGTVAVPGLEKVYWLSCPTLSDDLTTLVYLSVVRAGANADLYIAQRASVTDAFEPASLIESCASPDKEAYPALSADGLELIYTVLGSPSRLMYTRRSDRQSAFGAPRPLKLEGEKLTGLNVDGPQFIGHNKIRFATSDTPFTHRTQWVAERDGNEEVFRITGRMPFSISWPRYFLNRTGRRAYYPGENGIFLTALGSSGGFPAAEKLLPVTTIGPVVSRFDSTLWVAPQEDVIFYCSPGIFSPESGNHQLWMIDVGQKEKS